MGKKTPMSRLLPKPTCRHGREIKVKEIPSSGMVFGAAVIGMILFLLIPAVRVGAQPNPPDWVSAQNVWHITGDGIFLCDGCEALALYYSDMEAAGSSAAYRIELRMHPDWQQRAGMLALQAHSRGLRVMGALSNICFWHEYQRTPCPDALKSSIILDPYGIPRVNDNGFFPGDATWHSALDQAWEDYLLSNIQTYIDAGFDGVLIDEGAYVGEMYDFRPVLLQEFNVYLAASRTPAQLDALAKSLGFSSFSEFDYAKVWRDHLPPGTTKLTDDLWYNRRTLNIPLTSEYYTFLRQRTHEVMMRLLGNAKAYARNNYGRELPVSLNLNNIDKVGLPFLDLIDYVNLEFSYAITDPTDPPAYFPSARTTALLKLVEGLGIPGKVEANLTALVEIAARGLQNTGLFRTLIADAYAAGGTFFVEERFFNIHTDFPSISPWYRFVADHPELFNGLSPALTNVAILQLWEQYEWHPKRALNGAAALLADEGWQFDVLFSGEDVYTEYSGVDRLLPLTKLQQYPMVIIPTLDICWDCNPKLGITENNARLLLDYVDSGGHLVVFAGDNAVDNLLAWNPNTTAMTLYQRLKLAPANASGGNIIRIRDPWPVTYFQTQSATLRESLSTVLEAAGATHHLRLSGPRRAIGAFARANDDRMVIHLVNYDYDRASDQTTPVNDLVLSLDGIPSNAAVIAQTPDTPGGISLPVQFSGGIATVTVPKIEPWTVLSIITYSISPTSQSFPSSGGTGSVNVTAPSGGAWTATSNASWITIISGNNGTGNGTVYYSVSANTNTTSRTGTLTVAGQSFTVAQLGSIGCITMVPSDHWKGEYFNNDKTFSGSPSMVRDDGTGFINFNWGTGSPSSTCGIGVDNFSVRWMRTVSFTSGTYRFTVTGDDGFRLYIDDQLILDKWIDQPPTTYTADVPLSAGNHSIKMEYYEAAGGAVASLTWTQVGQGSCIVSVPSDHWKGEYFSNDKTFSGSPSMVRDDGTGFINFNWGTGSPSSTCGIGVDNFSVRWMRTVSFTSGTYRFTVTGDDGFRLYIDDQLILDKWIDQPPTTYTAEVSLPEGTHSLRMEYYEAGGGAVASLTWTQVGQGSCIVSVPSDHWKGEYFNNRTLSGSPSMVRDDGTGFINFNWGEGSPGSTCGIGVDNFSVRWTRTVSFTSGTYRFTVTSDDGVRLYVDDQLILDKWIDQPPTTYTADVPLSAGNHSIKMEYYEAAGGAVASLTWTQVGQGSCIVSVPSDHWKGEYFNNDKTFSGSPAMVRDDGNGFINFDWGSGGPNSCGIGQDNFSVRWTRTVSFNSGTYRFTVRSDDGFRLFVDGQPELDKWFDQGPTTYTVDVPLSAGNHTIKLEYYEAGGGATVSLSW